MEEVEAGSRCPNAPGETKYHAANQPDFQISASPYCEHPSRHSRPRWPFTLARLTASRERDHCPLASTPSPRPSRPNEAKSHKVSLVWSWKQARPRLAEGPSQSRMEARNQHCGQDQLGLSDVSVGRLERRAWPGTEPSSQILRGEGKGASQWLSQDQHDQDLAISLERREQSACGPVEPASLPDCVHGCPAASSPNHDIALPDEKAG